MNGYLLLFIAAVVGVVLGYALEGNQLHSHHLSPKEKLFKAIKWISITILAIYALVVVAAFTDGLGDIPLLGGGYVWVRGHWRRR